MKWRVVAVEGRTRKTSRARNELADRRAEGLRQINLADMAWAQVHGLVICAATRRTTKVGKQKVPRNALTPGPAPAMDPLLASDIVTRAKGLALRPAWLDRADRRPGLGARLGTSAVVLLVRFPHIMAPDTDGAPKPSKTTHGNTARPTRRLPVTKAVTEAISTA